MPDLRCIAVTLRRVRETRRELHRASMAI